MESKLNSVRGRGVWRVGYVGSDEGKEEEEEPFMIDLLLAPLTPLVLSVGENIDVLGCSETKTVCESATGAIRIFMFLSENFTALSNIRPFADKEARYSREFTTV